jgi:hypothetical protein
MSALTSIERWKRQEDGSLFTRSPITEQFFIIHRHEDGFRWKYGYGHFFDEAPNTSDKAFPTEQEAANDLDDYYKWMDAVSDATRANEYAKANGYELNELLAGIRH